jgi:hypothetical protein
VDSWLGSLIGVIPSMPLIAGHADEASPIYGANLPARYCQRLGLGQFVDGQPVDEAQYQTRFACHEANVHGHDYIFTRYALWRSTMACLDTVELSKRSAANLPFFKST